MMRRRPQVITPEKNSTIPYPPIENLDLGDFAETADRGASSSGSGGRDGVGSTGGDLLAGLALPDADSLPLDSGLSAECACVTIRGYQSMLLSIVVRFGL
jgi:hypothetical protein